MQASREADRKRSLNVWYDSRWRAYSAEFRRSHPLCTRCGEPSRIVDHVTPWKRGRTHEEKLALFWDPANHAAMCWPCHSAATCATDGGFGNPPKEKE